MSHPLLRRAALLVPAIAVAVLSGPPLAQATTGDILLGTIPTVDGATAATTACADGSVVQGARVWHDLRR